MPWAPPKHCPRGHPPYTGSRCSLCAKQYDRERGSAVDRGYDAEWRRVRAQHLAENPTCSVANCGKAAIEVDHVIGVRERPDLRLDRGNLRSMCKSHHSSRTITEQGANRGKGVGFRPDGGGNRAGVLRAITVKLGFSL
jgi:5-methylcytosine-specific restriction protein A